MKRLVFALLLPCLLHAGQAGLEPVTVTGADGTVLAGYRINTGERTVEPSPASGRNPPSAPADTGVLWVDRNHRYGICQAVAVSSDGYHVLANWYLNAQRAGYYRTLGDEVPVWESPGDFTWGWNGQQIGVARDGAVMSLSLQTAALKWSSSQYPDWTFPYPSPGTGFTRVSRNGARVVTCQNGTLTWLRRADGVVLWSAEVPEPTRLQGIDLSNNGTVVAVTVYDSCIVYEQGVRRDAVPIGTSSAGTQYAAAISGDGAMLVTGDFYGYLKLYAWDSTSSSYLMKWQTSVGTPWVAGVNISNDGSTIACGTGYQNGKLCVFDSSSSTPLWTYQDYGTSGAYVPSVALSSDGSRIAAASWGEFSTSGTYKVLSVHDRDSAPPVFSITRDEEPGSLFSCDISGDGQFVVAGGKAVHAQQMGNGGEVYAVIIGASEPRNVGVSSMLAPGRYMQVGTPSSVAWRVSNYGDSSETFYTHVGVYNSSDSLLRLDSVLVSALAPADTARAEADSFTPEAYDLYRFVYSTALAGDSYPGDDTMVMQVKCFHDGTPALIRPPNAEVTVGHAFTPRVYVSNRGSYSDDMRCLLTVYDSAGGVVYAESLATGAIPPDDTLPVEFPPLSIDQVGAYSAEAVVTCTDDFYPANDTLRYEFNVTYEIMYDDGGWEAFYQVNYPHDNDKFYVRFTPTLDAPYAITGGRFYVNTPNQPFDYVMVCGDAAGLPDTTAELGRVENVSTPIAPGWIAFDLAINRYDNSDMWMVVHWPDAGPSMGVGADATEPVDLRSYFSSNANPLTPWTRHDWMMRLMQDPNVGVAGQAAERLRFRLLAPQPNPFQVSTRLCYEVPAQARIALKIYDRTGRLVATPVSGTAKPGRYAVVWNAKDDSGTPLAPGVYFGRLLNADSGVSSVRKLTLVR
jgi:WD40 repeat protein